MRELTLNEKINFKWHFHQRGLTGKNILKLTMRNTMLYWTMLHGYWPLNKIYKIQKIRNIH